MGKNETRGTMQKPEPIETILVKKIKKRGGIVPSETGIDPGVRAAARTCCRRPGGGKVKMSVNACGRA